MYMYITCKCTSLSDLRYFWKSMLLLVYWWKKFRKKKGPNQNALIFLFGRVRSSYLESDQLYAETSESDDFHTFVLENLNRKSEWLSDNKTYPWFYVLRSTYHNPKVPLLALRLWSQSWDLIVDSSSNTESRHQRQDQIYQRRLLEIGEHIISDPNPHKYRYKLYMYLDWWQLMTP